MVTMKQVALAANVSTATVSRVLNGGHTISEATIERVREAMRELNYRPNHVARSLRTVSTRTLGVLVSNVANPFFAGLVHSIEDRASELGLGLILGNASEQPSRQATYLDSFLEKQVDGMIVTPTGTDIEWVQEMQARRLPLVFVDRTLAGVSVPSVTVDDSAALGLLLDHLTDNGNHSAALITGPHTNTPVQRRIAGFLAAANARGFSVRPEHVIEGGAADADGARAVRDLLALSGDRPDAIIALNNTMALGALEALTESGLKIPDDFFFASYDDTPWFRVITPPVSAVVQPVAELGRAAVELIARMIAGEEVESVTLPASFVPRGTTTRSTT